MEPSNHDQQLIAFAKQLASTNLEPGQYDLIMKEYIRLHKNQKEQKIKSINFLELLALFSVIFGTIFLGLFFSKLNVNQYAYLVAAILYFIVSDILVFKGKACSN